MRQTHNGRDNRRSVVANCYASRSKCARTIATERRLLDPLIRLRYTFMIRHDERDWLSDSSELRCRNHSSRVLECEFGEMAGAWRESNAGQHPCEWPLQEKKRHDHAEHEVAVSA